MFWTKWIITNWWRKPQVCLCRRKKKSTKTNKNITEIESNDKRSIQLNECVFAQRIDCKPNKEMISKVAKDPFKAIEVNWKQQQQKNSNRKTKLNKKEPDKERSEAKRLRRRRKNKK